MLLLTLLVIVNISACNKSQDNPAEIARQAAEDVKEKTVDAADAAVTATQDALKKVVEEAEKVGSDTATSEDAAKEETAKNTSKDK